MNKHCLLFAILFLFYPIASGLADRGSSLEIDSLGSQKNILDSLMELKQSEIDQLYLLDEQLNLTSMLIGKLEAKLTSTERRLSALSLSLSANTEKVEKIKSGLARNLRAFYMSYRPAPAVLFGSGDILKAARKLHYFKVTLDYIKSQMDSINHLQADLKSNQAGMLRLRDDTRALVERKNLEESLLEMHMKEKARLLARIEEDVNLRREYLQKIQEDERQLADLTSKLESSYYRTDFAQLKGSLEWPVKGKIVRHFGAKRDRMTNTETFSPGILIKIETESEVMAVAEGVIIHANYLHGYGNMIIVDHGEGWYSLYGHLYSRQKDLGETVKKGEVIGICSETGHNLGPIMFFGIRNRDESYDPVEWLK